MNSYYLFFPHFVTCLDLNWGMLPIVYDCSCFCLLKKNIFMSFITAFYRFPLCLCNFVFGQWFEHRFWSNIWNPRGFHPLIITLGGCLKAHSKLSWFSFLHGFSYHHAHPGIPVHAYNVQTAKDLGRLNWPFCSFSQTTMINFWLVHCLS